MNIHRVIPSQSTEQFLQTTRKKRWCLRSGSCRRGAFRLWVLWAFWCG